MLPAFFLRSGFGLTTYTGAATLAAMESGKKPLQMRYLIIGLFALLAFVRLINLSADPPAKLTTSQGVYTDPAAYSLSARNTVLFDDANPLGDTRFPLFERSALALLSQAVFSVCGVSIGAANGVALLFSLATIALLTLIVYRQAGDVAALFTLVLLLFNQNQYHYGRLPFLENAMLFFGVLSIWALLNLRRSRLQLLFVGAGATAAALFGKAHGVVFLPVVALTALLFHRREVKTGRLVSLAERISIFCAGLITISLIWYFYVAQGSLDVIQSYLVEQSTGIYGAPEALQSWLKFFWKTLSLGVVTSLFSRMPIASVGAVVALSLILWRLVYSANVAREKDFWLSPVVVCLALWFLLTYVELFPWNYRPLRYQLPLIYPTCALAAIWLSRIWQSTGAAVFGAGRELRWGRLASFNLALAVLLCFPVYQFLSRRGIDSEGTYKFADNYISVALIAILFAMSCVALIVVAHRTKRLRSPQLFNQSVVVGLLAVSLGYGLTWFEKWYSGPTYTMQAISRDLPKILGAGAALSGPYGVALTQENRIPAVVHQFGIADSDTTFFPDFPITHLLLDEANLSRFQRMYPSVAARSVTLLTYRVTSRKVELVKVAGHTGNPLADSYQPTEFEEIAGRLQVYDSTLSDEEVADFSDRFAGTLAANKILAKVRAKEGKLEEAIGFLEAELAICPSDFNILINLGDLHFRLYQSYNDWALLQLARKNYQEALRYHPNSNSVREKLKKAERAG